MIIRMIKECASRVGTEPQLLPAVTLDEVCKAFDPIRPRQCLSCQNKVWLFILHTLNLLLTGSKAVADTKPADERVDLEEGLVENEIAHTTASKLSERGDTSVAQVKISIYVDSDLLLTFCRN